MKLVVDIFGGDNSPIETVAGAVEAINEQKDLSLILTGDETLINDELKKYEYDKQRIEVVHAPEVISCNESPTTAIKRKKDSSLVVAYGLLKEREDVKGLVSAGSTGAVLAGGILKLGRIKGVSRPALAPVLPAIVDGEEKGNVLLIDCGANVDCKPVNLLHFALMGSIYMNKLYGIEKPRVALLSNGVEDAKGCALTKEAFAMLKDCPNINFVGNMEARDIISGKYDVVVSDGFYGNICLKSLEAVADGMMSVLKKSVMSSLRQKIGFLFMKPAFKKLKNSLDYNKKGGAVFLGVEKIVVKAHGSSKKAAFKNAILQAMRASESGVSDIIKEEITKMVATDAAENADKEQA